MNYQKIHDDIIERAKVRSWTKRIAPCYVERHHIIPKSLGGSMSWGGENVVCLTAKEHFIIHLLLVKLTAGKERISMIRALMFFKTKVNNRQIHFKNINSKLYQFLREEYAKAQSSIGKMNTGKKLSEETKKLIGIKSKGRNVGRKHTPEAIEKIREAGRGRKHTDKSIEKIRNVRKLDWENRRKNNWSLSDETKAKKSEITRLYWEKKRNQNVF